MDDELERARHALRGVDHDIDLTRVYAESRTRVRQAAGTDAVGTAALGATTEESRGHTEVIEVWLSEPAAEHTDSTAEHSHRARTWGALVASVAAVGLGAGLWDVGLPPWTPATSEMVPATDGPPTTDPSPALPTRSQDVLALAAHAISTDGICLQTRSTLGDAWSTRLDPTDLPGTDQQAPDQQAPDQQVPTLAERPLWVLQQVAVDAALRLAEGGGTPGIGIDEYLGVEQLDGDEIVRIRTTPAGLTVPGGEITRIDLLIDTATWLPRAQEARASSDQGEQFVLNSEFSWPDCDSQTQSRLEAAQPLQEPHLD